MSQRAAFWVVFGVAAVAGVFLLVASRMDDELPAAARVSAGQKVWRAVAPGRVEPRAGLIKIAAAAAGIVEKVLVKANDTVFAGQPLIQLKADELDARLTAAEAQVAMRRRARDEQSASGKAEERRRLEDSVADAERAVFDAQAAVDSAAAAWRSGQPDGSLTAAQAALARAQNDLRNRRAQLRRIETEGALPTVVEAQLAAARADLAAARAALEKMTIRAPIDGTVLQININPGELASLAASPPLLLMANLSALSVRVELDERDMTDVAVGQTVSVRANAFPERTFSGRVTSIAPLVESVRLGVRGAGSRSDVDAVEVMIDLVQPGPLTVGMRVDVYFGQANEEAQPPERTSSR